ncbi:MAG TPA: hypothetical protein PKW90_15745 [Myxococcota bacterium]|nr:hypothetical protein [Myxococcota bacterium]
MPTSLHPYTESPPQRRIAERCARLTCLHRADWPWADEGEPAASLGLDLMRDGRTDPLTRQRVEIELNQSADREYGLGRTEFEYLMDTLFMTPKYKERNRVLKGRIGEGI